MLTHSVCTVSDACQINDFDHTTHTTCQTNTVSDACQINDFDHTLERLRGCVLVSDACQINDFDHFYCGTVTPYGCFRCLSDQ